MSKTETEQIRYKTPDYFNSSCFTCARTMLQATVAQDIY